MKSFLTFKQKIGLGVVGSLVLLNIFVYREIFDLAKPSHLEVSFFDVGQGDAIFIETPQNHQILIDGGPDNTVLGKLQKEMPFWDRTLDIVILTHPDADHITGLLTVLKKYKIKYILWTGVIKESSQYKNWIETLQYSRDRGAEIVTAASGQKIKSGRAEIKIIYPLESLINQDVGKSANETSVILQLNFGQVSFLLTGDTVAKVEKELVAAGADLKADILKVAHHGSKTSTSREFLAAVAPKLAVIQLGKDNRYGHPHPNVLQNLKEFGINVLRTDTNGDIKIFSDGNNILK